MCYNISSRSKRVLTDNDEECQQALPGTLASLP